MSFGTLMIVGLILVILGMLLGALTVVKTIKRDIQIFSFAKSCRELMRMRKNQGKTLGKQHLGLLLSDYSWLYQVMY